MALSVVGCSGFVRRRLDGEPSVPIVTLCNWAGDHLVNMHAWGWLEQSLARLNLVAGRSYVDLPANFGSAIGTPRAQESTVGSIQWVTMDEVAALRSIDTASSVDYYGAIAWRLDENGTMRPRIELSNSIGTSQTAAYLLSYRVGWAEITDDSARLTIPTWIEPLYLEILFAFAQAYDEHDLGSLAERLASVEMSPQYMAAQLRDGGAQPSIGMMSGGAVQMLDRRGRYRNEGVSANDPT